MSKFLPLLLLIVTLLSGMWLRAMWAGILPPSVNSQFLLHAHSHIALLGWVLMSFLLLFWKTFYPDVRTKVKNVVLIGLFLLSLFMFHAFFRNGYALWSIVSSMIFILITWIIAFFYLKKRSSVSGFELNLWDTTFFWLLFSSLGPLLLSLGTMMGQPWILFWVSFYLYLQFLGWIVPTILLLLNRFIGRLSNAHNRSLAVYNLMLLPAFFSGAKGYEFALSEWGWVPMIALSVSMLIIVRSFVSQKKNWPPLFWSAISALVLAVLFLLIAALPGIKPIIGDNRMAAIGFVHMILLGGFTALALEFVLGSESLQPKSQRIVISQAVFLVGAWLMVAALMLSAILPLTGWGWFLPIQDVAFWCGIAILVAVGVRFR